MGRRTAVAAGVLIAAAALFARLSRAPGRIAGSGRPLGVDTDEVLSETARPEEVE